MHGSAPLRLCVRELVLIRAIRVKTGSEDEDEHDDEEDSPLWGGAVAGAN
jgi:hypothetical protein